MPASTFEKSMLRELEKKYIKGKQLQTKVNQVLSYKTELEPDDVSFINKAITETEDEGITFPEL